MRFPRYNSLALKKLFQLRFGSCSTSAMALYLPSGGCDSMVGPLWDRFVIEHIIIALCRDMTRGCLSLGVERVDTDSLHLILRFSTRAASWLSFSNDNHRFFASHLPHCKIGNLPYTMLLSSKIRGNGHFKLTIGEISLHFVQQRYYIRNTLSITN